MKCEHTGEMGEAGALLEQESYGVEDGTRSETWNVMLLNRVVVVMVVMVVVVVVVVVMGWGVVGVVV